MGNMASPARQLCINNNRKLLKGLNYSGTDIYGQKTPMYTEKPTTFVVNTTLRDFQKTGWKRHEKFGLGHRLGIVKFYIWSLIFEMAVSGAALANLGGIVAVPTHAAVSYEVAAVDHAGAVGRAEVLREAVGILLESRRIPASLERDAALRVDRAPWN